MRIIFFLCVFILVGWLHPRTRPAFTPTEIWEIEWNEPRAYRVVTPNYSVYRYFLVTRICHDEYLFYKN